MFKTGSEYVNMHKNYQFSIQLIFSRDCLSQWPSVFALLRFGLQNFFNIVFK